MYTYIYRYIYIYIYLYLYIYIYRTGVNIVEFSVSEAGGGTDLTDSLIMQQKQRIREGVKQTGGSARNATECVTSRRFKREKSRLGPGGHVQLVR